jgi:hypothetical protein
VEHEISEALAGIGSLKLHIIKQNPPVLSCNQMQAIGLSDLQAECSSILDEHIKSIDMGD